MSVTVEEIKKLKLNEKGRATLAVASAEVRQTSKKTDFLSAIFVDKTGSIKSKSWDWSGTPPKTGDVWDVDFVFSPFKNSPQIVVSKYQVIPRENVEKGQFVDSLTPAQFKYYKEMLHHLIGKIKDKNLQSFVEFTLIKYYPTFSTATGARSNHHARLGGLLQHTCHVTQGAINLADGYKGTERHELIDYDILIAGALLHDLAKIDTYTTENLVIDYSLQGTLCSDYDLSPAYLREAYIVAGKPISEDRMLMLQHILVSHHGKEYSNKPPSTFSATLVHAADMADAFTDKIAENIPDGVMTDEAVWSVGNRVIDERKLK